MPKAITELLHPEWTEDKSTSVAVGKGGVNVDASKGKPGGTNVNVGGPGGFNIHAGKGKPGDTNVNIGGQVELTYMHVKYRRPIEWPKKRKDMLWRLSL